MKVLNDLISQWAEKKGILKYGHPIGQATKTLEECNELLDAVDENDEHAIIDAIGDIYVTLQIQCVMQGVTMEECVRHAYNEIKDRKGKMNEAGQFVKE